VIAELLQLVYYSSTGDATAERGNSTTAAKTNSQDLFPVLSNPLYSFALRWIVPIVIAELPTLFPIQVCASVAGTTNKRGTQHAWLYSSIC
jgi:hypothetical protein